MSVTGISLLESARRKFFMNSTYITSRKLESNVLASRGGFRGCREYLMIRSDFSKRVCMNLKEKLYYKKY